MYAQSLVDFVEAPSQCLENWVFDTKVLKRISSHHETGEPMPDDLSELFPLTGDLRADSSTLTVRKLILSRDYKQATNKLSQIFVGACQNT